MECCSFCKERKSFKGARRIESRYLFLLKQIIEDQSSSQIKLINQERDVLRITGLIEDKTSNEMKQIYNKLESISDTFPENPSID